jgi:hypothetical protein
MEKLFGKQISGNAADQVKEQWLLLIPYWLGFING